MQFIVGWNVSEALSRILEVEENEAILDHTTQTGKLFIKDKTQKKKKKARSSTDYEVWKRKVKKNLTTSA